jgi:hypothetical protein
MGHDLPHLDCVMDPTLDGVDGTGTGGVTA